MKFHVVVLLAQLVVAACSSAVFELQLDAGVHMTVTYDFGLETATFRFVSPSSNILFYAECGDEDYALAGVSSDYTGWVSPPMTGTDITVTGIIYSVVDLQSAIARNEHFISVSLSFGSGFYDFGAACLSACGDPHFAGFDGVKYQFRGEHDQQFALISDPTLQLNSKFVKASRNTYLGATCLRVCNHTVRMLDPHIVHVDGKDLSIGSRFEADGLVVRHPHKHSVQVEVAGRWAFGFEVNQHVDVQYAVPMYAYDNRTHGVMGHTMGKIGHPKGQCEPAEEGGCEVEGDFKLYEVHGDLCSTEWTYAQYSSQACAAPATLGVPSGWGARQSAMMHKKRAAPAA